MSGQLTTNQQSSSNQTPASQKHQLQLYFLLKKFLTAKYLPSTNSNAETIAKYLRDISLSTKLEVISRLLKDTQSTTFNACNLRFMEILLNDDELTNVVHMGQNPNRNSMGGIWREALLGRHMDESVRSALMQLAGWMDKKSQRKRSKMRNTPGVESSQNRTRRPQKKLLGFDEIRFDPDVPLSCPEAYNDEEWKYLTRSEQRKTLRKIRENYQRLEKKEQAIVALLSKQRFVSQDEYDKLDELARNLALNEEDPQIRSPEAVVRALKSHFSGSQAEDGDGDSSDTPLADQFTQERMARLFSTWIQEHIEYQQDEDQDDDESPEEVLMDYTASSSKSLARLFQRLCQLSSIECILVQGVFRDPEVAPSRNMDTNHWWNVCKMGANFRLVDCSWPRERGFFMDPREFLQSHMPSEKDAQWALISRESISPSVEDWKANMPNYSCTAIDNGLHVRHETFREKAYISLEESNFSSLAVEGCTIEDIRVRVLDATHQRAIPFSWSLQPDAISKMSFTLHLCFPHSGDFEVELWIPKSADVLHHDDVLKTREEHRIAEKKRLQEEEEERIRQQEEAAKADKKKKPKSAAKDNKGASTAESADCEVPPSEPENTFTTTHCIATVRHVSVSNQIEIQDGVGFPMNILEEDFELLSHPNPIVKIGADSLATSGVTFRFLSSSMTQLENLNAALVPLPSKENSEMANSSAKGKKPAKAPAKKGKGPDLETEDLSKYIVQQKCPLEIALLGREEFPVESCRCLEFTFLLPAGCEGRSFEITALSPKLKYCIEVAPDASLGAIGAPLIPERCEESSNDEKLYVPLPFEWKLDYVGTTRLTRVFIQAKKPIECKDISNEKHESARIQEWEIPTQKKGLFRVVGCIGSEEFPLVNVNL